MRVRLLSFVMICKYFSQFFDEGHFCPTTAVKTKRDAVRACSKIALLGGAVAFFGRHRRRHFKRITPASDNQIPAAAGCAKDTVVASEPQGILTLLLRQRLG